MFDRKIPLFRLMGIRVNVDPSWVIIVVLITWSLSTGLFPSRHKGLDRATYWMMGGLGTLGLFASIVIHELAHSITARRFGISIRGITLFVFGGVAEMRQEPPHPRAERFMALAGPLTSIALGGAFWTLAWTMRTAGAQISLWGTAAYLSVINWVLAGFNLLPAFPLDGGRVLRSVLWGWRGDLVWATRVSSRIGSGFGIVLISMGVFRFLMGHVVEGAWWFLIGAFLRGASRISYRQLMSRDMLKGEPISRFMRRSPVTVPPGLTLQRLVDHYFFAHHFKMFPVVDEGRLMGCVTLQRMKGIPRESWKDVTISEVLSPCSDENTISPEAEAFEAISKMQRSRSTRLMVVEDGRLEGVVSLRDLMNVISRRFDSEA